MKKIAYSLFLPSFLILLLVALILIPHQGVSSRGNPLVFTRYQVKPSGTQFDLNETAPLAPRGSPPPVPTGVSASKGDFTDRILVSWGSMTLDYQVFLPLVFSNGDSPSAPIPDVTDFQIYRNTTDTTDGAIQLTEHHPASPYADTTADPGETYYYWVKACNSAGCSDYSSPDCGWQAEILPPAPTGVSASDGLHTDKVTLVWDAAARARYYQVFRNIDDYHTDEVLLSEHHPTSPFDDIKALPGVTYHYWVKACNSAGCSEYSSSTSGMRAEIPPDAPTDLSASQGEFTDRVHLVWSAADRTRHYQIYRHTIDSHSGEVVLENNNTTCTYDDTTAIPGVTYHYWVQACNTADCSDYSSSSSGWRAEILPAPPAWVSASDGAYTDMVSLSWGTSDYASHYQVYRNIVETVDEASQLTASHPASPYEDTSADPGVAYFYWIMACNTAGCSDYSSPDSGWRAVILTKPLPPTDLSASDGEFPDKVRLTWTASDGAADYQVFRNTSDSHTNQLNLSESHPASPFDDQQANPGVTYYYWVKACNAVGCSDYSPPDTGYWAEILPDPPSDLSASNGDYTDKVLLYWTPSEGASGYHVYRNTINNHTGQLLLVENHPDSTYADLDAAPGVTYYYWVIACNSAGCSDYSSSDFGWRAEIIPLPPEMLSASDGTYTDKVHLAWTASEGAKYYLIFQNTSEIHAGEVVLTEDHTSCTYDDLTPTPGVIYFYWVKACNSAGCSPYSTVDSGFRAEVAPDTPKGLTASEGDHTDRVHLSWTPSENANYYQVFRNTHTGHDGESMLEYSHPTNTYDDMTATPGVVYYYWIKACNIAGCSLYSTNASGWRAEITPLAPNEVNASDGAYPDKVLVSWIAPEGATYFMVYRNSANNHSGETVLSESHPASPYEDASAVPETTYFYWVKACNSAGCSAYSLPDTGWRSLVNIANGDFEAGNDGSWTVYSKLARSLILHADFASITPHSGDYLAWMGGEDGETARLTQSVTIPPSHPYLHFWYIIDSADTCDNDYARVKINGGTFTVFDLCSPRNTYGWASAALNLSAYAGETVTLQFEVTTDTSYASNFYLDDVLLSSTDSAAFNHDRLDLRPKRILDPIKRIN